MQWPMPWLEALGLLAVVFAAGNGIGFGLSRLSGPLTPGKARPTSRQERTSQPAPQPADVIKIAETPQWEEPLATAPAATETPKSASAPVAETLKPERLVTAPAEPPPPLAFTMRVRYSVSPPGNASQSPPGRPFGVLSVTRPNPDQPSS
jgi:hypothetical protein